MSTGKRYNKNKLRWRNIPLFMLEEVVKVGQFGEEKYSTFNFLEGLGTSDTLDSLKRHLTSFESPYEPDTDEESNLNHLAHVCWNALVALHHIKHRPDLDDRYKIDDIFDEPITKKDTIKHDTEYIKRHDFKFERLDRVRVGALIVIVVERYYNEDFKPIYLLKTDKGEMFSEVENMLEMAKVDTGE